MIRKLAFCLLLSVTLFAGCKKKPIVVQTETPAPAGSAAAETLAPPPKPDEEVQASVADAPQPAQSAPSGSPVVPAPAPGAAPKAKVAIDQTATVMALCYHNIEDDARASKALTISVKQFEQEMEDLKASGFTVISMQDFLAWRRGEKNIPKKSCLVTIDDGWVSGYAKAWPVLKKHGYPFTMFIYIEYVGTGGKSLSWAQLGEMRDAGVDIQCHTWTHSNLRGKGNKAKVMAEMKAKGLEPWLRHEIIDSKHELEKQLGIKVNVLAYPYGVWSNEAKKIVKEAGYEAAFTVYGQQLNIHSPSDLLGRYAIEAAKPQIFQSALKMQGGGVAAVDSAPNTMAQLAATSMITQPMNNETVETATPTIKVNLASMGEVEPTSLILRLSGLGTIPVNFDSDTKMLTAKVTQKLAPGNYTVIISAKVGGQPAETRWDFAVSKTAK